METVNGFTVIARAFDRNGQMVILGVREHPAAGFEFEYVTAWMAKRGDNHWYAGHYHNSWLPAFHDFQSRVTE